MKELIEKAVMHMMQYYLGSDLNFVFDTYYMDFKKTRDLSDYLNQFYFRYSGDIHWRKKNAIPMPEDVEMLYYFLEYSYTQETISYKVFQGILRKGKNLAKFYRKVNGNCGLMYKGIVGINHPTFGGKRGIYKVQTKEVTNRNILEMLFYVYLLKPDAEEIGFYNYNTEEEIILQIKDLPDSWKQVAKTQYQMSSLMFGKVSLDEVLLSKKKVVRFEENGELLAKTQLKHYASYSVKHTIVIAENYDVRLMPHYHTFSVDLKENPNLKYCKGEEYETNYDFGKHGWYVIRKAGELTC